MDLKRDIVDTICHASRAIGHNPTLGFPFPIMWGVVGIEEQFTVGHTQTPHTQNTIGGFKHQLLWVCTLV